MSGACFEDMNFDLVQGRRNRPELGADLRAHCSDAADDDYGDQSGDEPVLDGSGAGFVVEKAGEHALDNH